MNPRIARVKLDGLLEFANGVFQVARFAIGTAEENMELRSRAHVVQQFVKQKLCFSQLVLTKIGERQRVCRFEISLKAQGGVQVFRSFRKVALRELDVSKQLQTSNVARIALDHLGGLLASPIQVPCPIVNHG